MIYEYHLACLKRGAAEHATLAAHIARHVAPAAKAAGGAVLAQFAPQLGFASNEAAVLMRWSGAPADVLAGAPSIESRTVERVSATARPGADDVLRAGGIYVHRWFTIDAKDSDEFVSLSTALWVDFERAYETQIFGLFAAERTPADGDSARLLLLTWYSNHGEWERSRDPTTEAMRIARSRALLTRATRAASTRLASA